MASETTTVDQQQEKPQDVKPADTRLAPARAPVPVRMGLAPQGIEEGWRLATLVAQSDIVPKDFRGKPHNVLIAMEMGLEIGIPWLQAVQGTAVINGRPGPYGDLFLAILMSSPIYVDHDEYYEVNVDGAMVRRDGLVADDLKKDDTAAVCTFWRKGKERPVTRRFTMGQAKKAGLTSKTGPWQEYPERQLQMRARGFAGRDCFPDVLKGVKPAEELMDIPIDETVIESAPVVRRISETPSSAPAGPQSPAPASAAVPEAVNGAAVTVGPSGVTAVDQVENKEPEQYVATLANGKTIVISEAGDAMSFEIAKSQKQQVTAVCVPSQDGKVLTLQSFTVA
jgi:hypothetical protein